MIKVILCGRHSNLCQMSGAEIVELNGLPGAGMWGKWGAVGQKVRASI